MRTQQAWLRTTASSTREQLEHHLYVPGQGPHGVRSSGVARIAARMGGLPEPPGGRPSVALHSHKLEPPAARQCVNTVRARSTARWSSAGGTSRRATRQRGKQTPPSHRFTHAQRARLGQRPWPAPGDEGLRAAQGPHTWSTRRSSSTIQCAEGQARPQAPRSRHGSQGCSPNAQVCDCELGLSSPRQKRRGPEARR